MKSYDPGGNGVFIEKDRQAPYHPFSQLGRKIINTEMIADFYDPQKFTPKVPESKQIHDC